MSKVKVRNFVSSMLCALLILCGIPYASAEAASDVETEFLGKVNLNLSSDGSQMLDHVQEASFNLSNVTLQNDELNLAGAVSYNDDTYSVNISSKLYKSESSDNTVVGDSSDQTSNFDIPNLSIIKDIPTNKLLFSPELDHADVIQFFLLKKGTRELSMFEIPTSSLPILKDLNVNVLNDNKDISDEHWWLKLFTPVMTDNSTSNTDPNRPSVLATNPPATDSDTKTFTYSDGPGNVYRYEIGLKAFSNVYSYNKTSPQTDSFGMQVTSHKYYYNNVLQSNVNPFYVFNVTGTEVLTSPSGSANLDEITLANWGNITTSKKGGLTISNPTLTFGTLLNVAVNWTPTSTVVTRVGPQAYQYGSKVCGVKIPFVEALNAVNDQYTLTMTKNAVSPSTQQKISGAVFTYSIGFAVSSTGVLGTGQLTVANNYY